MRNRWIELALLALYLLGNGVLDRYLVSHLDIDSHKYLNLGEQFLQTGRFVTQTPDGTLATDYSRTPVFTLVIAAAIGIAGSKSAGISLVIWLQRLVWAAVVLFALPGSVRSNGRPVRLWNIIGKIALLFSPVTLYHGAMLLTDLMYAALLFLAVRFSLASFCSNSKKAAALAGVLQGTATLLRPFHAPVPFATCLPWVRKRSTCVVVIIAIAVVMTLAWMARNYRGTGTFSLGSLQGRSMALHREDAIRKMEPSQSSALLGPQFIKAVQATGESAYTGAWIIIRDHQLTEAQADVIAGEVSWEAIRLYPFDYLGGTVANTRRLFWSRADGEALAKSVGATQPSIVAAFGYANALWSATMLFLLPALLLALRVPRRLLKNRIAVTNSLVVAYVLLLPAFTTVTYGRFLLPALPFIGLIYCMADSGRRGKNFDHQKQEKKVIRGKAKSLHYVWILLSCWVKPYAISDRFKVSGKGLWTTNGRCLSIYRHSI